MTERPDAPAATELTERLEFALAAAREASDLILRYFQAEDLAVDVKQDASPVTVADRGAEELIRSRIAERYPQDGVLGEEFGETPSRNGWRWILDPIDGTKSFVHGVPLFGTLIGVEFEGRCVVGVSRFPALDEVVYAAAGQGTWWQRRDREPRRARVTTTPKLSEALFCSTTLRRWGEVGDGHVLQRLVELTRLTRGWGDCYGHCLVATGRADLMIDPKLSPWDAAALVPILQEAGGHFLDFEGRASIDSGCGMSVNDALRDEILAMVRKPQES